MFGLMKMADRASAVQRSVTNVALIRSLPILVCVSPRSTRTAYTTASDVVDGAVPAIKDARVLQSRMRYAVVEATTNGPRNETTPIPNDAPSRRHVHRIDFHPGEKCEDDRSELGDEVEPLLRLQVKEVARRNAEGELEQGYGHAELDRDHAGDEDYGGEDCCELD